MESSNSKISRCRWNEDRLSSLSDTLLQRILSFLDSNYAVKSSLLSKRWRDLWVSLPILNFYTNMTNVDNLLLHRDGSDIHSFCLKNGHGNGYEIVDTRLYSWILIAIRHNIQELDLDITSDYPSSVPISLFTCQSLTILNLKFQGCGHQLLRLPYSIKLPRLKDLHLISVCFLDANECYRLISSCLLLQSLILCELELLHPLRGNLNIFIPTLEHLKIETYYDRLDIYAPNLISLNIKGSLTRCYLLLGDFNSLVNAEMDMDTGDCSYYDDLFEVISAGMKRNFAQDTINVLQLVSKVNSLALSAWVMMILSETPFGLENQSTQFVNLKHMKLSTYLSLECIRGVTRLLQLSPGVETLKLEFVKSKHLESPSSLYCYEKMINSVNSEECSEAGMMLYHLNVVEVRGFVGCLNELKMLKILLKSCVALERLVIFTFKEKSIDTKQKLIKCSEKLVELLRPSSKVSILFF